MVRRHRAAAGEKSSMYAYLAPGGHVPSFPAAAIKVLAGESKKTAPPKPTLDLTHGTCIKLYNYRWKKKSLATTEARLRVGAAPPLSMPSISDHRDSAVPGELLQHDGQRRRSGRGVGVR